MANESDPEDPPADERIGRKIHMARRVRGLTQNDLAKRIGVSFQQLQKYENGANRVSAARLATIADVLGVSVQSFYEAVGETVDAPELPGLRDFVRDRHAPAFLASWSKLSPSARRRLCEFLQAVASETDGICAD